jgi:hypothetical protein
MAFTVRRSRTSVALATATATLTLMLGVAGPGHADSTPVGPLPAGPVSTTITKRGQLVAVALPQPRRGAGLVWRLARSYDSRVVRQVSEADVANSVVLVYRVVGRGNTSLVFALTRGEASAKAVKASTYRIRSV